MHLNIAQLQLVLLNTDVSECINKWMIYRLYLFAFLRGKDSLFISGAGYLWSVDIRKLSFLVVICICPLIHLSSCSISHMQYLKSQLRSLILIAFIGVVIQNLHHLAADYV